MTVQVKAHVQKVPTPPASRGGIVGGIGTVEDEMNSAVGTAYRVGDATVVDALGAASTVPGRADGAIVVPVKAVKVQSITLAIDRFGQTTPVKLAVDMDVPPPPRSLVTVTVTVTGPASAVLQKYDASRLAGGRAGGTANSVAQPTAAAIAKEMLPAVQAEVTAKAQNFREGDTLAVQFLFHCSGEPMVEGGPNWDEGETVRGLMQGLRALRVTEVWLSACNSDRNWRANLNNDAFAIPTLLYLYSVDQLVDLSDKGKVSFSDYYQLGAPLGGHIYRYDRTGTRSEYRALSKAQRDPSATPGGRAGWLA